MDIKGTTIVAVQKDGKCALAGDGQVTLGEATIMKHTARKVRRIYNDSVVVGFAGGVCTQELRIFLRIFPLMQREITR